MLIFGFKGYIGMREELCVYCFIFFFEVLLFFIIMRLFYFGLLFYIFCGFSLVNNKICYSFVVMGLGDFKEFFYLCNLF